MFQLLLPTNDRVNIGHIFKRIKEDDFTDEFIGMLFVCVNPLVNGSNETFEAEYLYNCSSMTSDKPKQGAYYISTEPNEELHNVPFCYLCESPDRNSEHLCYVLVNDEKKLINKKIFKTANEIHSTTDINLIKNGVVRLSDNYISDFVERQNKIVTLFDIPEFGTLQPLNISFKEMIRPYMLKLVHDCTSAINKADSTGFELDEWMDKNL